VRRPRHRRCRHPRRRPAHAHSVTETSALFSRACGDALQPLIPLLVLVAKGSTER
jgi:hypothetical protein